VGTKKIKGFLSFMSCDLPAAQLVKLHNYLGYFGCGYCNVEGEHHGAVYYQTQSDEEIDERTHEGYLLAQEKVPLVSSMQLNFRLVLSRRILSKRNKGF